MENQRFIYTDEKERLVYVSEVMGRVKKISNRRMSNQDCIGIRRASVSQNTLKDENGFMVLQCVD